MAQHWTDAKNNPVLSLAIAVGAGLQIGRRDSANL
jgi:hypothetical protein